MAHPLAVRVLAALASAFLFASVFGLLLVLAGALGLGGVALLIFWVLVFLVGVFFLYLTL